MLTKEQIKKDCRTFKAGNGFWTVSYTYEDGFTMSAVCTGERNTRKEAYRLRDEYLIKRIQEHLDEHRASEK